MFNKRHSTLPLKLLSGSLLIALLYLLYPTPTTDTTNYIPQLKAKVMPVIPRPKIEPVKAAFVVVARNSELQALRASLRQLEDRFNAKFHYPYVFLGRERFSDLFRQKIADLVTGPVVFGQIEDEMWSYPDFVNQTIAGEVRDRMAEAHIVDGGNEEFRFESRFFSGFFHNHPLLDGYDYYWRLKPSFKMYCDIDYDVFQMMKDNKYKYGWVMSLPEDPQVMPSLWSVVQEFVDKFPHYVNFGKRSLLNWISDNNFESYNGCHFWSGFEIVSLKFLRSEKYKKFFEFLDSTAGFFYEKWGHGPIRTLAVSLLLKTTDVHFFNDIGYNEGPFFHCPMEKWLSKNCWCNPSESLALKSFSCNHRYKKMAGKITWNEAQYQNKTNPYRIQPTE